jgi:signal transduction histidine kinase/CheY-like chemotaxis protein
VFFLAIALVGWWYCLWRLMTERLLTKQLTTRRDLLHKAISASHAGVFFYNPKKNRTIWDENSLRMFGLNGPEREISPGTWEALIHPDDRLAAVNQVGHRADFVGNLFNHTYRIVLADGSIRWIEGTAYVMRDEADRLLEIAGFHFDITKQQLSEESLRSSESKAVLAMEGKTQFLANMSHEIRTPMNAIVGMIELLQSEQLNAEQQRYLQTLQHSSHVLLRIIDDILDISKIEAGKVKLEHLSFSLREVFSQCLAIYTQASDSKAILLTGWVDPLIPETLIGDSTRLQQIIMNLLSNAFKFTQAGHILLRVTFKESNTLHFSVADTGIGIAADTQAILFDRFTQADDSTSRKFGGSGLGLTIAKNIINLWGGEISVQSALGEGATFSFTLPFQLAPRAAVIYLDKVLLCTQHRTLARLWWEDPHAPPMEWVDSVEQFDTIIANTKFSAIIVEHFFPGCQGRDLIQRAKKSQPALNATLMGFERFAHQAPYQDSIDHYCPRPFFINQLWDASFISMTGKPTAELAQQWPNFAHLRVLCVDDTPSNLLVLSGLLKRFGISASTANSGLEAIARSKAEDFDLILMDYEMPVMNGPAATRAILEAERLLPTTPLIIGLSAHVGTFFEAHAQDSGMQAFLPKPIRINALQTLLEQYFAAG